MNKLKFASTQIDRESSGRQPENGRQQGAMLSKRLRSSGKVLTAESAGESPGLQVASAGKDPVAETQTLVIGVELFG